MSKVRTVLFAISVFVTAAAVMWQSVEIVVANELYVAFPESEALVTAIMSWPGMLTAITSVLTGFALSKITTKVELIIACLLMLTGVLVTFSDSKTLLLVCSLLMAIGAGFANTAGMSIISEVFRL
jgi:MFS family permease